MKYLIIRNKGTIPLTMLTHLGISTSRGDSTKIGQFGSGAKHGVLVSLRAGLGIEILSGTTRITPKLRPIEGFEHERELVYVINNGERTISTSMTASFGEIDWKANMELALREFFSNALDAGERLESCWQIVEHVVAEEGITKVIIPLTFEIEAFVRSLSRWFISKPFGPFEPETNETGLCYLKGVYVGRIGRAECPALFNYNFDSLPLTESREVTEDLLRSHYPALLTKSKNSLVKVFQKINEPWYECQHTMDAYVSQYRPDTGPVIVEAWRHVHDKCYPIHSKEVNYFTDLKLPFQVVPSCWHSILSYPSLGLAFDYTTAKHQTRFKFHDATPTMIAMVNEAWSIIESLDYTYGKAKPAVKSFTEIIQDNKRTLGYCLKDVIFFNLDEDPSLNTVLEELAHYISGADDFTREFQEYIFKLMARMCRRMKLNNP